MTSGIRPAFDTLKELNNGNVLDQLGLELHNTIDSVKALGKPGTVTLVVTIKPLTKTGLTEAALGIYGEVSSKPPRPEPESTVFFVDNDGNPTRNLTRQREITFAAVDNQQDQQQGAA